MKNTKGITLIALVITIIILIILAGISISMLMGENGLITKAKQGALNYQNAAIEEQAMLNNLYGDFASELAQAGSTDAAINLINFKRIIAEALTNAGVATSENDSAETMAANIGQAITTAQTAGHDAGYTEGHDAGVTEGQASAPGATLVGSYTGNQTIDVSAYIKEGDTKDNFIVEIVSVNSNTNTFSGAIAYSSGYSNVKVNGNTISKSLSGNNLTISGATVGASAFFYDTGTHSTSSTISYKVWHV